MKRIDSKEWLRPALCLMAGWASIGLAQEQAGKGREGLLDRETQELAVVPGFEEAPEFMLLQPMALESAANEMGVEASQLTVAYTSVVEYPMMGVRGFAFALHDGAGAKSIVVLNEAGQMLDFEALETAEREAYEALHGKLHPVLVEQLSMMPADSLIPVVIWLREDDQAPEMERPDPREPVSIGKDEEELMLAEVDVRRTQYVESLARPMILDLNNLGFDVSSDPYVPMLQAELDAQTIEQLSRHPGVDTIYFDGGNPVAYLDIARQVVRANIVNNVRGILGAGVRVAVIEPGGRVQLGNPFLHSPPPVSEAVTQDGNFGAGCPVPPISDHATAVSGIIRSLHGVVTGIARGAILRVGGSCNAAGLRAASSRAADAGSRVQNHSWGFCVSNFFDATGPQNPNLNAPPPDAESRFYDSLVYNRWRTIVFAAGNRGGPSTCGAPGCFRSDGYVTSPGSGYNVLTVGMGNDNNTVGTGGDTLNPCSSWKDPLSAGVNDREKPELAAPGVNLRTTLNAFPFVHPAAPPPTHFSGTSAAAPVVTGGAALLMQRDPTLQYWPEGIKAILMATAIQNLEGASRLSERDGAGSINLEMADNVLIHNRADWGILKYGCSSLDFPNPIDVATVNIASGRRIRVAIAWNTNPGLGGYADRPTADVDVSLVRASSGATVASSLSFNNTYEIIDYRLPAGTGGNYIIRISRAQCQSVKAVAYAWIDLP